MSPTPGEVWLADPGRAAKTRPVRIVSRHDPDSPSRAGVAAIYQSVSSQKKADTGRRIRSGLTFRRRTRSQNLALLPVMNLRTICSHLQEAATWVPLLHPKDQLDAGSTAQNGRFGLIAWFQVLEQAADDLALG